MSFSFKNSVDEVSIEVNVFQRVGGVLEEESVVHLFKTPTASELDTYRQKLTSFKGRRPKVNFTEAESYLWNKCILKVEGYEGIPENWKEFFLTNDKARIHASSAVNELIEIVQPTSGLEKN